MDIKGYKEGILPNCLMSELNKLKYHDGFEFLDKIFVKIIPNSEYDIDGREIEITNLLQEYISINKNEYIQIYNKTTNEFEEVYVKLLNNNLYSEHNLLNYIGEYKDYILLNYTSLNYWLLLDLGSLILDKFDINFKIELDENNDDYILNIFGYRFNCFDLQEGYGIEFEFKYTNKDNKLYISSDTPNKIYSFMNYFISKLEKEKDNNKYIKLYNDTIEKNVSLEHFLKTILGD